MQFLKTFLLSLFIISAFYLAVAVVVDAQQDFNTSLFPVVVSDARAQKMRLFTQFQRTHPVEGLVIGSSRSMKLDPVYLQSEFDGAFFNFAVDSARSEDYLAIYRWVRRQGAHPKYIIIGLDIDALHSDDVYANNLKRNSELLAEIQPNMLTIQNYPLGRQLIKIKRCFSISYLNNTRRSITTVLNPSDEKPLMKFDANGYLCYCRYEDQQYRGTYDLSDQLQASFDEYQLRFKEMRYFSPQRLRFLQDVISEATADGAIVCIWITSFHPKVLSALSQTSNYQQLLEETRTLIQENARSKNVYVFDFNDPSAFKGDAMDWFDGIHVGHQNANKIVQHLAEGVRR